METAAGTSENLTETEIEKEETRREIYLRSFIFYLAAFSLAYTFVSWYIGYMPGIFICFSTFCCLVILARVNKIVSLFGRSNALVLLGTINVYFNAFFTGGIHSPVTAWLAFIPLIALILGEFKVAVFWLTASLLLVGSLYIFYLFDLDFKAQYDYSYDTLFQFAVFGGLVALVFFISYLFDNLKNKALDALDERNKELNKTKSELLLAQLHKDRFIATVSHELRTPMNAILGVTDIISADEQDTAKLELLTGMKTSADNLLVLINDILDISRIQAGKMNVNNRHFNLRALTEDLLNFIKPKAAEQNIQIISRFDSAIPHILIGDPSRIHQILNNLIGNSLKFTHQGKIEMAVSCVKKSNNDILVLLEVEDTGIGIPEDKIGRVFESFEQLSENISRNYGGTGLGLAITKQLAELLGGNISVVSEEGKGSRFTVSIPLQVAEEQMLPEPVAFDSSMPGKLAGIKILLAEDSLINQLITRRHLESMIKDIQIDIAHNGEEAVEKTLNGSYHIILMDVLMPRLNGLDAVKMLRSKGNKSRIMAMTASVMENEIKECYEAGMNDFVAKPYDKYDLIRKIYLQLHPN